MSFSEWKEVKLGDVAEVLSGYAFKTKDFFEEGIPVVKIKNIVPPIVDIGDTQYVSEELYKEKIKYGLKYNDILISMTGSHINQLASAVGKIGRVKLVGQKLLLNQRVGKLYVKDSVKCNQEYLYYFLTQDNIRYDLAASAGGSANQANISPQNIRDIDILLPPLKEQKAIANILSSLDEKIELNNQMNKTLEEMAQALFKRWFVDFEFPNEDGEPYKSSGGEMVDSELGMIPKGWKVSTVGEMGLDISDGNYSSKYPTKREFISEGVAFIRGTDFQAKAINRDKLVYISLDKHKELKKGHTKENDILITTRGEIGMIAYVPKTLVDNNINAQLVRINGGKEYSRAFLGNLLESKYVQEDISSLVTGSALQQLPVGKLKKVKVILSPKNIRSGFDEIAISIIDKIELNNEVSYSAQRLRDTLLPKLMSGEIRVTDLQN